MKTLAHLFDKVPSIEGVIGHIFKDKSLLALAFVHRSYVNENQDISQHNERLEFLGDSVLGLIISEYLYHILPNTPEGDLSNLRSRLVEAGSCVTYVQKLKLEAYLLLGKGERFNDGRGRETILADLFEAVIGAIYLDGGLQAAQKFIFTNFHKEIEAILQTPQKNWKALLQDYSQRKHQKPPVYKVISETGPDHSKQFKVVVFLGETEVGEGVGSSKKVAQQSAAEDAVIKLHIDGL